MFRFLFIFLGIADTTSRVSLPIWRAAPVIVYCGTGKRAALAKNILESKHYTNVYNAGAFKDIGYLEKKQFE